MQSTTTHLATIAICLLALFSSVRANEACPIIAWSGRYEAPGSDVKSDPNSPTRETIADKNPKLLEETLRIPAKLGTSFGYGYKLCVPKNGQTIRVTTLWRFPPPGMPDLETKRIHKTSSAKVECIGGAICTAGWEFTHESELLAGKWDVEIWSGRKKLLSRTFVIEKP